MAPTDLSSDHSLPECEPHARELADLASHEKDPGQRAFLLQWAKIFQSLGMIQSRLKDVDKGLDR